MNGTKKSRCKGGWSKILVTKWIGPSAPTIIIVFLLAFLTSHFSNAQSLPPDPRFGAVEAFYDPQAAQDLNLGWERILFLWNEFQPNGPDQLNIFQVQDSWLTEAAAHGRQVVGLIERTPPWATDGVAGSGVPRGLNLPIDDPNNVWASFVRALVKHYADRVDHWIIWNEPDIRPPNFGVQFDGTEADYYQLVKVAYQVAKQENPNAVIHLAGLTFYQDHKYLQHFIDVAKKDRSAAANHDYFDVATLHIYFTTDEVYNVAQIIRNTLRLNGLKQPMWINEANAFPSTDPLNPWYQPTWTVSLDQQADFLVHSFALSLAAGADRIAVYKLIDVPPPLPGWYPEGVIRSDGSHRPAYAALKVITTYFRNTRAARLVRIGSTDIVTLDRVGQTTRIAWTRSASAATVFLPALAQQATLIGVNGATQTIVAVNNQYKLSLPGATCDDPRHGCFIGGSPIILVEDAPSKSGGSVIVSTVTPSAPCINCTPTPTLTLQSTQTITPTSTVSPQPTATSTATPTASPTYTFTPTPTVRPAPTSTPNIASTDNDPPIGLFAIGAALVLMLIIIWRGRK